MLQEEAGSVEVIWWKCITDGWLYKYLLARFWWLQWRTPGLQALGNEHLRHGGKVDSVWAGQRIGSNDIDLFLEKSQRWIFMNCFCTGLLWSVTTSMWQWWQKRSYWTRKQMSNKQTCCTIVFFTTGLGQKYKINAIILLRAAKLPNLTGCFSAVNCSINSDAWNLIKDSSCGAF